MKASVSSIMRKDRKFTRRVNEFHNPDLTLLSYNM